MNNIIVNTADRDPHAFLAAVRALKTAGHDCEFQYVQRADDGTQDFPGGWGCLKFPDMVPEEALFALPDVEYRWSEPQEAWVADGKQTSCSIWLKTLHKYFLSSPWGSL